MATLVPFLMIGLACVGIFFGCNLFEPAADYLGRNMKDGVKGATINAVGSSLPELFTTLILLFLYRDMDGFSGGVATTAGSAVFNAVLIPACAILAVTMWARATDTIEVSRKVLLRDGIFVIIAEVVLIIFLGHHTMYWWMGAALLGIYLLYFGALMWGGWSIDDDDDDDDDDEEEDLVPGALVGDLLTALKGGDVGLDTPRAWGFLMGGVSLVGLFCFVLSEATVQLAETWDVPLFLTTVIFAAAATSVPDTILSVKDALKGNYDDAVANAIGSNIFDVCISLGLPLTIYGIVVGPVDLAAHADEGVQVIRWVMLGFTVVVLAMFFPGKVGKKAGLAMLAMYGSWVLYIAYRTVAA